MKSPDSMSYSNQQKITKKHWVPRIYHGSMDPLELSRFLGAPFPGVVSKTRAAPGETSCIEDVEAMMEKLGLHLTEPSFKPLS